VKNGILYVIYNKWINNPETHERITKTSIEDRYYGLGLKMPGKFETLFAYKLDDYEDAETLIHGILKRFRENGEWFTITQKELDLIKANCEAMGGTLFTDEVNNDIEDIGQEPEGEETIDDTETTDNNETVEIKGVTIPLYRNSNERTQDYVKRLLHLLFNNALIPDTEISNLLDKKYSSKTFGISEALLQNDKENIKDRKGHTRYWTTEIFDNKYYACSQWWKDKEDMYASKIEKWIRYIRDINK